jgi:hypothetical protein
MSRGPTHGRLALLPSAYHRLIAGNSAEREGQVLSHTCPVKLPIPIGVEDPEEPGAEHSNFGPTVPRIIGLRIASSMRNDLVPDALEQAL